MTQDLRQAALLAQSALERLTKQMFNLLLVADVPQRFAASFNDAQKEAEAALAALSVHLAAADMPAVSGSDVPARPTSLAARDALWRSIHAYRAGKEFPGRVDDAIDALLAASPPLPQEQGAVPQQPLPEMEVFVLFNRHRPLDDGSEALAFARAIEAAHCIFPAPPAADPGQAQMGETK